MSDNMSPIVRQTTAKGDSKSLNIVTRNQLKIKQ